MVLTVELTSESASVTWFRDGVQLTEGSKYEMKKDGMSRTLVVKSTEAKDSGTYSCHSADDKIECKVQVKGEPLEFSWEQGMYWRFHTDAAAPSVLLNIIYLLLSITYSLCYIILPKADFELLS